MKIFLTILSIVISLSSYSQIIEFDGKWFVCEVKQNKKTKEFTKLILDRDSCNYNITTKDKVYNNIDTWTFSNDSICKKNSQTAQNAITSSSFESYFKVSNNKIKLYPKSELNKVVYTYKFKIQNELLFLKRKN